MKTVLRILIVEDSEDDALLVLHQIKKGGYDIEYDRVETAEKMKVTLKEKTWDIILSDYKMPHFNGLEALKLLKENGIDIPFLVISGTIGEEVAVEMMKAGAHDYIMKNNLQRLLPAIERELRESKYRAERKLLEQKQEQAEQERLAHLRFFECMDRINLAIHGTNDLEQMMRDVLDALLSIFDCDQVWLLYPCDPNAPSFRILMEITKPGYPGPTILNVDAPMSPDEARNMQEALESDGPVTFTSGTERPISIAKQISVQSRMFVSIYPKLDLPWLFGMSQCSYPRVWTQEEKTLFQEVGWRLADGLSSLLIFRDLMESEEKYRTLIHKIQAAVLVHGADTRILISNSMAQELLGLTEDQLLGKLSADPDWHFFLEDGTAMPLEKYPVNQALESRQALRNFIVGVHRPNKGKENDVWCLVNADPIFDKDEITQVIVTFIDISKRKRAEEALRKSNRELRAISNCNQTLLRAVDEQTLLNEVCRIICDEAGYHMSWVGYAERDEAKTIRPVAWAGFDSGYIANAKLSWADNTERGRGPAGKAIRSGELNYVQDFATDPQMTPWRESALQRGYRSGIALPLKDECANVFGVLLIYSTEANSITPDEIRIIVELASDLAFGITALRIRAEHKRAKRELEESEAKMRSILDNIGIGVALISPRMEILELNQGMRKLFPAIDPRQHTICYRAFNDPPHNDICNFCPTYKTLQDGLVHEAITQTSHSGAMRSFRIVSFPILNASGEVTAAIKMIEDITEKLSLESQLRQAQKMESIGRLAGGVAHDFNNMLGVIIGYTDFALNKVDSTHPLFSTLNEIHKAAERSANLTRQLLTFARKQIITPKALDLNETVGGMLVMLQRLIGEDIDLILLPGAEVWPVKVDSSQVDQIMANLCVNARDAIAGVGKVTIETHSVTFDENYCGAHIGFIPGEYVRLAVSDDGCGMNKDILDKLFEPFFTTKEIGKGTGLGLATVYGIVKQNNGFIDVHSEPGHGTTFNIYLPRHMVETEPLRKESPAVSFSHGQETILLVEDEPLILDMGKLILDSLGYSVLSASTPGEAIRVARGHAGEIHLLLSDVIMPEMNGWDLAKDLISFYPGIKLMFMSGYTCDVIADHGLDSKNVYFIEKPFSMQTLAAKVREALDSK